MSPHADPAELAFWRLDAAERERLEAQAVRGRPSIEWYAPARHARAILLMEGKDPDTNPRKERTT